MKIKNVFYIFLGIILTFNVSSCERDELTPNSNELTELIKEFDLEESTATVEPEMRFNTVEEAREALYKFQAELKSSAGAGLASYKPSTLQIAKNENDRSNYGCTLNKNGNNWELIQNGIPIHGKQVVYLNTNTNKVDSWIEGASMSSYSHKWANDPTRNGNIIRIRTKGVRSIPFSVGGVTYTRNISVEVNTSYNTNTGFCNMEY